MRGIRTTIGAAILLALLAATGAFGQDEIPTKVNNQNRTGDLPFSTSIGTDIERVDIASGSLNLTVPFASVKGRGMDFIFALRYNGLFWNAARRVNIWGNYVQEWKVEKRQYVPSTTTGLGWENNLSPYITWGTIQVPCSLGGISTWRTNFIYNDPNGGKHPLAIQTRTGGNCVTGQDLQGPDLTGEGIWAKLPSVGSITPDVLLSDGKKISLSMTGASSLWRDSNGNLNAAGSNWTDTLGRVVVSNGTGGPDQLVYVINDSNGTPQNYTVNHAWISVATNFGVSGYYGPITEYTGSRQVITSIVLPNGRSYQFQYENNSYGGITRVDLPTGAYITYTWATLSDGAKTHRYVASRTVNVGGETHTWTFNRTGTGGSITTTVTDPQNNQSVYGIDNGFIYSARFYQGAATGTPLRQHGIDYVFDSPDPWEDGSIFDSNDPAPYEPQLVALRPIRIATTLEDGQVNKKEFDYETFNYTYHANHAQASANSPTTFTTSRGKVSEVREYHYGAGAEGALARKTTKTYLHNSNATYKTYNVVDKVLTETVYDGAGAQKTQTQFEYDSTTITATSGVPQHDYTSHPSTFTYRGNPTRVKRWRNTDGALLTTTYEFDDLGNLRKVTDPLNHTVTVSYDDRWHAGTDVAACQAAGNPNTMAYATEVKNHLNHRLQFSYYHCTGLRQARKDENDILAGRAGVVSAYDLFGRLTQQHFPDGGQVSITYNDLPPVTATTTTKITSSMNLVSVSLMDGLGRPKDSKLTSDPQGIVFGRTDYDSLGRQQFVWNPTRCDLTVDPPPATCAGEPTFGKTETQYDALNRVTRVIPPDGSSTSNNVTTTYSGNCTTVTDQAGKIRKSCTDALGRLIQVFEPNQSGSLVNETAYQYDALDNLICVVQKGTDTTPFTACGAAPAAWRPRSFTYDSLSQLLTATNPESGTITYVYDNDGNLLTKNPPAPNQTGSATVTTTYAHDPLHRLTQKSYSDGTTATVKYGYDAVAPTGCTPPALTITNGIGRRTSMCDAAGTEAWSYDITLNVGWKTTNARTTNGVTKTVYVQSNFDGSVATLSYPSGRAVTYAYNAAARPVSAIDSVGPINYATGASYAPTGALSSLTNGASLVSTLYYNNRVQPCRISVRTAGAMPTDCADTTNIGSVLDFTYCLNSNMSDADRAAHNCAGSAVQNNGNVAQIANNRTTARTQNFKYDELNRVQKGYTESTTGQYCWGEQFGYDIWANLLTIGAVTGYTGCTQENLSVIATTKNQISGDTYDSAGNLLSAPGMGPFTYDAENRLLTAGGVTYTYEGDGKRAKKSNGKLYWYGMSSDPLTETDLSGTPSAEFIFFNGKRTARLDLPGATVHYYFSDHLGSASVITNASGTMPPEDESDYYPFGGERTVTNTDPNQYKFTGKERDTESGLDFFIARYYSSGYARFLSPDEFQGGPVDAFSSSDPLPPGPLPYADIWNPQSLNKYAYTYNNPQKYVDPDGHILETLWDAANVGLGAASFVSNVRQGNVGAAVLDAVGVVADTAAAVVPFVPGGAGTAIRLMRAADKVDDMVDAAKAANKLDNAVDAGKAAAKTEDAAQGASKVHGNTAGDQPAQLYEKYDKSGNFEKHGVSQDASKRYSKKEVAGGRIEVVGRGPRKEMLKKERERVETSPGPKNKEPWAGKKKPGQPKP